MHFLFWIYVFLLPFFSSPYLYSAFRSWSTSYSLVPMILLLGLLFLRSCCYGKFKLATPHGTQQTTVFFGTLQFYSIFVTFLASLVLEFYGFRYEDAYRGPAWNCVKEVVRATLTFLAFYLVVTHVKTERDVLRFLRVVHLSLAMLIVYGYCQMLSIILPDSIFHSMLETITPFLDQGWHGEKRFFPYADLYKRVNLLTPEASTAAQILEVYFLPLLLASILSDVSAWPRRIFGVKIETFLLFFTLTLIIPIFSSIGFYVAAMMLVVSLFFSLSNKRAFSTLCNTVFLSIGVALITLLALDFFEGAMFFVTKIYDLDVGSTNTRYAFWIASFDLFLHNPWGVGTNNNNLLMAQYVPDWAQSNPEIVHSIANENLPTLNLWSDVLSSIGLVGLIMFMMFFISLWRNNAKTHLVSAGNFNRYAFLLFLLAFFMHGFNTSSTTFLWLWSICGFYAAIGSLHPMKVKYMAPGTKIWHSQRGSGNTGQFP
mgnify:CR=1 FL=1